MKKNRIIAMIVSALVLLTLGSAISIWFVANKNLYSGSGHEYLLSKQAASLTVAEIDEEVTFPFDVITRYNNMITNREYITIKSGVSAYFYKDTGFRFNQDFLKSHHRDLVYEVSAPIEADSVNYEGNDYIDYIHGCQILDYEDAGLHWTDNGTFSFSKPGLYCVKPAIHAERWWLFTKAGPYAKEKSFRNLRSYFLIYDPDDISPIYTVNDFFAIQPGKAYQIMNDLDFEGLDYKPINLINNILLSENGATLKNILLENSTSYPNSSKSNGYSGVFGVVTGSLLKNIRFSNISIKEVGIDRSSDYPLFAILPYLQTKCQFSGIVAGMANLSIFDRCEILHSSWEGYAAGAGGFAGLCNTTVIFSNCFIDDLSIKMNSLFEQDLDNDDRFPWSIKPDHLSFAGLYFGRFTKAIYLNGESGYNRSEGIERVVNYGDAGRLEAYRDELAFPYILLDHCTAGARTIENENNSNFYYSDNPTVFGPRRRYQDNPHFVEIMND